MIRLVVLGSVVDRIEAHLRRSSPREDGCFCLVREGRGHTDRRLMAYDVILPPPGAWEAQERDQLRPSAIWLSAALSRAITEEAGLLFVHSHPDARFPPGLSPSDHGAFRSLAATIAPMLDGPFSAAVVHPEGWTGVTESDGGVTPINSIAAVGRTLRDIGVDDDRRPVPLDVDSLDTRQRDALGVVHDRLLGMRVAIVGAGGLGSPIAEVLVRMGVRVGLFDHDLLDTPSNARRVFGSRLGDLDASPPRSKVDVVGEHLDCLGLAPPVDRVRGDVRREAVFRRLLDYDVVIAATDTHGSRAILNQLPSCYLLPIVDVGVRAGSKRNGHLAALVAEVRVVTPTTPCLWCRGTISADVIWAENLPPERREALEAEGYLVGGVGRPAPSVAALTVLGAGVASCALLALVSDDGDVSPSGFLVDGFVGYTMPTGPEEPMSECRCRERIGAGDRSPPPFLPA
jgi:molybdopterin/thiamine biosynthesis adenylyltransferase